MLPYKSMLNIDPQCKAPIYIQIANGLIKQIVHGRINAGLRLPGARKMAEQFSVNRKTIENAYQELEAQGWVNIVPAKGAFVNTNLPITSPQKIQKQFKPKDDPLKKTAFKLHEEIQDNADFGLDRFKDYPYNFDDGYPDTRIAPIAYLSRHYRSLLNSRSKKIFDYSWDLKGSIQLREALVRHLSETRGINVTIENILITRGTVMGIHLLFKTIVRKGENVIVASSNYGTANQIIENMGGNIIPVKVDEKGIDVDEIEKICKRKKIRAIYVIPHHHHPTTVSLSCGRRMKLLILAEQYKFAIIEDDYDFDFHYESSPILPLASSDQAGLVAHLGSFSKSVAPAFRIGFVVAPENLINLLARERRYIDRQGDNLMEGAIAEMINEGELRRHLRKAIKTYRQRRDHFCHLFKKELGDIVDFKVPDGGLAVWTKFDPKIDLDKVIQAAKKKGLFMVDHKLYNPKNKNLNASRIGFASMTENETKKALKILKSVFVKQL